MEFTPNLASIFKNEKITVGNAPQEYFLRAPLWCKFIKKETKAYLMNKNEKYFLNSLRCALLLSVVGAYNKEYTVQPSARASPKFFFRYATEKLRISQTLGDIFFNNFFYN